MATAKVRSQNNIFFLSRRVTFLETETGIVHSLLVYSVGSFSNTSRGGTPVNSWWGCAARFSKSRPYFRSKNVVPHPFSDLAFRQKLSHHYLD